jgi:hypothetical protein
MWFLAYEQSVETLQLVIRTICAVFPLAVMFASLEYMDLVWVASDRPIVADFRAMEDRFDEPAIRNDLARIDVTNLAAFLAHHAVSAGRFRTLIDAGAVNTAAHQRLEYAAARSFFREEQSARVLDLLPYLGSRYAEEDVFLEGYVAFRDAAGEPVKRRELEATAAHLETDDPADTIGRAVAGKVRERAATIDDAGAPASRPARGAQPKPEEMGFHELCTWAERLFLEGDAPAAAALLEKALTERPVRADLIHTVAFGLQQAGEKQRGWALISAGFERALDADRPDWQTAGALAELLRLDEEWGPRAKEAVQRRLVAHPREPRLLALAERWESRQH